MAAVRAYQSAAVVVHLCRAGAICADDGRSHDSSHRRFAPSRERGGTSTVVGLSLADLDTGPTARGKRHDEEYSREWCGQRWCRLRGEVAFESGRAAEVSPVWCAIVSSAGRCAGALYLLRSRKHCTTRRFGDEDFANASRVSTIEPRAGNGCAYKACEARSHRDV